MCISCKFQVMLILTDFCLRNLKSRDKDEPRKPEEGLHFGRLRQKDHMRSGVQDQPGQHGETLPLLKIQKLAGHGGGYLGD
uniref:Macaca fascicularis brain cDNA clone: QflA-18357, similar to human hypothetical gene supported by AK094119 (LOC401558), mRNA, RefSeq: XM_379677.1 n=1 Tax=Macaca fascicularis TaxID=9541 RepID=Q8HXF0_MACFA|nr:hypothetical protein [Macaca fascicularis]BAE89553.1 unnamed protein product [Macaca fascicularis]